MAAYPILAHQLKAQAGERQCLTVNMVLSAGGGAAEEGASLPRLLVALSALALERFGAAPDNRHPHVLRELAGSGQLGGPVDLFAGRPLHFRKEASGYRLHSIGPALRDDAVGKDDLVPAASPRPKVSNQKQVQRRAATTP
jgi:hypothetical protein